MTDWFKQNPFLGGLGALAAVILLAGGYLVSSESNRLSEEQASLESKTAALQRLQSNKPFPSTENVKAAQEEQKQAAELLDGIAKSFAVTAPPLDPRSFQDELNKSVKEILQSAADKGVALPEGFYLGFEAYETQPPAAEAATQLGLQLRSIHAVVKVLVESQVKSIGPILRDPLGVEAPAKREEGADGGNSKKSKKEPGNVFGMAPFDVNFTGDQTTLRAAFNRILEISPPVFVRLVAVTNSALTPPSKSAPAEAPQPGTNADSAAIKPVFGRETVTVDLRLASINTSGTKAP